MKAIPIYIAVEDDCHLSIDLSEFLEEVSEAVINAPLSKYQETWHRLNIAITKQGITIAARRYRDTTNKKGLNDGFYHTFFYPGKERAETQKLLEWIVLEFYHKFDVIMENQNAT